MRYQFYREHKYVSAALNDVERLIAKADFHDSEAITQVAEAFEALAKMLIGHAQYENERLHTLLKEKQSAVYAHVEKDHANQDVQLEEIRGLIDQVFKARTEEEKTQKGYQLYLTFRKFVADNLAHLHEEETEILPELQRLYTDEELQQVEAETYREMMPEQLVDMIGVLFPHMNPSDRQAILKDFHDLEPEKFAIAWKQIHSLLPEGERHKLEASM